MAKMTAEVKAARLPGKVEAIDRYADGERRRYAKRSSHRARCRMDHLACQGLEVPSRLTQGYAD